MGALVVRLDDACPTMAREQWQRLDEIFARLDIKPIVGVIPACLDRTMNFSAPDPLFWDKVRDWHGRGWEIAMHGLNHVYHAIPPSQAALVPYYRRSEFVGLPVDAQREKIAMSARLFAAQGIEPRIFMAPGHSFDRGTIEALLAETNIRWITDGISHRPFSRFGINWLPQQTPKLPGTVLPGVWTVCIHPNTMDQRALDAFVRRLERARRFVIAPEKAMAEPPQYGASDRLFAGMYWPLRSLRRRAVSVLKGRAADQKIEID